MSSRLIVISLTLVVSIVLITGQVISQEAKGKGKGKSPTPGKAPVPDAAMDEMMKKMMQFTTPGPQHKQLEQFTGKWDATVRVMMGGPGAPPMESKGTLEGKMIMGGRYLQEEWKGSFMGMPVHGMVFTGYDLFKKCYVSFMLDSMSTAINSAMGNWDANAGKVLRMYGHLDEYLTGEHDKNVKYVHRIISPDRRVFEIHDMVIGEPNTKVVEISYTRSR